MTVMIGDVDNTSYSNHPVYIRTSSSYNLNKLEFVTPDVYTW